MHVDTICTKIVEALDKHGRSESVQKFSMSKQKNVCFGFKVAEESSK
jgi:hypothetical protein